jgi:hypothetical protein
MVTRGPTGAPVRRPTAVEYIRPAVTLPSKLGTDGVSWGPAGGRTSVLAQERPHGVTCSHLTPTTLPSWHRTRCYWLRCGRAWVVVVVVVVVVVGIN